MALPYMSDKGMFRPTVRTQFGGLNHNKSAGDGEIFDMVNMSSREYPLLTPRARRGLVRTLTEPYGAGAGDEAWWVDGTGFYYDGVLKGTVTKSQKQFALMGSKIIIMPDKAYYDAQTGIFGVMGVDQTVAGLDFRNGVYMEVPADANTLYRSGADWASSFSEGDAVTISGCTVHPENNGSFVIREIDGDYLHFYENTFTLDSLWRFTAPQEGVPAGDYYFYIGSDSYTFTLPADMSEGDTLTWNGTGLDAVIGGVSSSISVTAGSGGDVLVFADIPQDYSETGDVTLTREVPDMDYVCVNENRLWGCKGDSIYASKLGDPFNFNVFDGLSSDSWAADAVDSAGDFTGCVSYMGYPVFFKEDNIYTIQGDSAKNFAWTPRNRWGVKSGCADSIAVAGETLFYLSRVGVCAYTGGFPSIISAPLGVNAKLSDGVAGSDGIRYYISLYHGEDKAYCLYVYDTRYGVWHKEDESRANSFYMLDGSLHMLLASGDDYCLDGSAGTKEGPVAWEAKFADMTRYYETTDTGSQDKKGILRLQLRCELDAGTELTVSVSYDKGSWHEAGKVKGDPATPWSSGGSKMRSYNVPLILRRYDNLRIKLSGSGKAVVYSLTEVRYSGSNLQGGGVTLPNA